jgi:feruloyl esterase
MKIRQVPSCLRFFCLIAALAALALRADAHTAPAVPQCSVAALSSLGVRDMTIISATEVPAATPNPSYCDVRGSVTTSGNGAADGSAGFEIKLPANWNDKFLFLGVGGLAGSLNPEANRSDVVQSLVKGYATAVTDTGHQAFVLDGSWALESPGVPDRPKVTDYFYRAAHDVTVAAKHLVEAFFNAEIRRSYFDGCSNGGRMGLMEATRFPEDYDGIIAGAPFLDMRVAINTAKTMKQILTPSTYIPAAKLAAIDRAIYASCDAADGVTDGLIQNPARCSFDPDALVPSTLTQGQAETLEVYLGATRDRRGRLIYPGFSVSDLHGPFPVNLGMDFWTTGIVPPIDFTANEPWGNARPPFIALNWTIPDNFLKFIVERDPGFDVRDFDVSTEGVVGDRALALFDRRTEAGDADIAARLMSFIARGKKVLIYHGFSDPALPPFRTVKYYEDLADLAGGYRELQESVRLFMLPGMHHCSGGPGPNAFDTLTPLENWVEHGVAPDAIVATHYVNNSPALGMYRTMPLCQFPEQARYSGTGNVNDASNWTCSRRDRRLLQVGSNGVDAGLSKPDRDDHDRRDR